MPDELDEGGIFRPAQYSPFASLIEKARTWIGESKVSIHCKHLTLMNFD